MILPTRQQTTYCTLTDRHTDRHKYTEQIQRDRKRERRRKAEDQKQIWSVMPADKLVKLLEDGSRIIQKEELNGEPVG